MKKSILIIANYFYPDVASLGQIITDYCIELKNEFNITVIAAIPNYSEKLELDENLKNKKYYIEKVKGIDVIRIVVPNVDKRNKLSRIKYILSYYNNSKYAIKENIGFDVILTVSQPPVLGGMLGRYAKSKNSKSKMIYNIQDFNPEQIEAVKFSKLKPLIYILKKIDNISIKAADRVLLVGSDQIPTLEKRNNNFKEKAIVINNWSDDRNIIPLEKNDLRIREFKKKYGLENKFIIMYSGNIGLFYDLKNLIKVTLNYKNDKDIAFVFVGDGAVKKDLEEFKKINRLENIYFIPYQPKENLVVSLNVADVHLVVNAKGIKGVSVPSKLYGVMAAGKAVIGVLEEGSEARNLIEDSKCGVCVDPNEYNQLSKNISKFIKNEYSSVEFGVNGRKYLDKNLSREKAILKYKKLISEI